MVLHAFTADLQTTVSGDPLYLEEATTPPTPTNNNDGVREKLEIIRQAINDYREVNPDFLWRAERWGYRLAILPTRTDDNASGTLTLTAADWDAITADPPPYDITHNVRRYSIGTSGMGDFQTNGAGGDDGDVPEPGDYNNAYEVIEREVDLFNLLVLPPDRDSTWDMTSLWADASVFCEAQRAFLLMDPPSDWIDAQSASQGVDEIRVGLKNEYSAVFYPNLVISETQVDESGKLRSRKVTVGPAGAIAGLMARIDNTRGVWKAPAGIEANLLSVAGAQYRFSDSENGILNPRGINTIRIFPNGIVNWGARTNARRRRLPE